MLRTILAAMLALSTVGTVSAQSDARTRNRLPDYLRYLRSEAVRQELTLTADQTAEIRSLDAQHAEKSRTPRVNLNGLTPEERARQLAEQNQKREAISQEFLPRLRDLLTPEQLQRLKQIDWQFYGGGAVLQEEVAKAIQVTAEQQAKLDTLYRELGEQLAAKGIEEIRRIRDKAVPEILTAEQSEQLARLKGKPFDVASLQSASRAAPPPVFGGRGTPTELTMLRNVRLFDHPAVQAELALTEQQKEKISALLQQAVEKLRSQRRAIVGDLGDLSPEQRVQRLRELREKMALQADTTESEYLPQLTSVLTPEQVQRMRQIRWQAAGTTALLDPELAPELKLTEEQRAKLNAVNQEASEKLAAIRPTRDQFDAARTNAAEINAARNKSLLEVLTAEQKEQLEKVKGRPFDVAQLATTSGFFGGPPFGGPSGFGGGGPGPAARPNIAGVNVFNQAAVLKDLGLTDAQQAKIAELFGQLNAKVRAITPDFGQVRQLPAEELRARLAELAEKRTALQNEYLPLMMTVLTAEQSERLQQIRWQAAGAAALLDDALAKQLNLSSEQQERISAAAKAASDQLAAVRSTRGGTRQEFTKKTEEINSSRDQTLLQILTPDQQAQLTRLQGKPFDLTQLHSAFSRFSSGPRERPAAPARDP